MWHKKSHTVLNSTHTDIANRESDIILGSVLCKQVLVQEIYTFYIRLEEHKKN